MALAATVRDLEALRPAVEAIIGRPLRRAEQAIDVVRLDHALETAKNELEDEIRAEMQRAVFAWLSGMAIAPALRTTPAMLAILDRLVQIGRQEAELELGRLGYVGVRRNYADVPPAPAGRDVEGYVRRGLGGIQARIENDLVVSDLSGASQAAVAQAILGIPGARDLASRVISTALIDGMGTTWEANADLVSLWEYTAVLDGGTCEECAPLDGTTYSSLDELFAVLPNFGPNPACYGGGRCRCRAVPASTGDAPQVSIGGEAGAGVDQAIAAVDVTLPLWRQELGPIAGRIDAALAPIPGFGGRVEGRALYEGGITRDVAPSPGMIDTIPGPAAVSAEADVAAAGGLIDDELELRLAPIRADVGERAATETANIDAARAVWKEADGVYRSAIRQADAVEVELRERLRQGFLAQGLEPFEAFRAAQAAEEMVALKAANQERLIALQRAAQEKLQAIAGMRARLKAAEDELARAQRDELEKMLAEHRGLGRAPGAKQAWRYSTAGVKSQAKQLLEQAARFFPTDWIEKGNLNELAPRFTKNGRGYHEPFRSSPSTIVISGGERSKIVDDPSGFSTAIHELGHHLEHTDPRLKALEWAFYQRRTRAADYGLQEAERALGAGYRRDERYRPDGFSERYMGKTYGNGPLSSYELLTMGLEALWTGSYTLDAEMRRFILGLLFTL